jgi:hypothetical protein
MQHHLQRDVAQGPLKTCVRATVTLAIAVALSLPHSIYAQQYNALQRGVFSGWQRIRMDGFTVMGTTGAKNLRQVAIGIAAFTSALTIHFPHVRVSGQVPTFVVVLKDFEAYRRFQPRDSRGRRVDSIAGYLESAADANYLVFPYERGEAGSSLVYHEFTHYVIRQNVQTEVPLWLEEGLAEFYATFRPDFRDASLLGAAPPERIRTLRQEPYVALRQVVSTRAIGQVLRSPRSSVFYAEAWALVHYITMERQNSVQAPFDVYLTTLAETGSQDEAFKAAFGVDVDDMDRELQSYVRYFSFRTAVVPRTAPPRIEPVEAIPQSEARQFDDTLVKVREMPNEYEPGLPAF